MTGNKDIVIVSDDYLPRVRTYAIMGYSRERVCRLLELPRKMQMALAVRLSLPGDVFYETYEAGLAQGEKNIDMELAKKAENGDIDAIELLEERKNERYFKDLRKELFGI